MTAANWRERYTASVLRSYFEYMKKNEEAPVKTRQLTAEEFEKILVITQNTERRLKYEKNNKKDSN